MSERAAADDFAARITVAWKKQVQSILETGRLLIEAKDALGYGHWGAMIERKLPFGERTAQSLMEIAKHPVLSNPQHAAVSPPHWATLSRLTMLPDAELKSLIADGGINCETTRGEVEEIIDGVRKGGMYLFHRVPEALNTLQAFMQKWPDADELMASLYGELVERIDAEDMWKLLDWLSQLHAAYAGKQAEEEEWWELEDAKAKAKDRHGVH